MDTTPDTFIASLSAALAHAGLADEAALSRARRAQAKTGERFDRVLTELGIVPERALAGAVAHVLGLPLAESSAFPEEPLLAETLPADFLARARLKDIASEAPVIRFVADMIARAVERRASDIHVEPQEDHLRVRFRRDGRLEETESLPRAMHAAVTSRLKIMARLDIAERRLPQDGRIKLAVRGREIDFRVSSMPSLYGEGVGIESLTPPAPHPRTDQPPLPATPPRTH